MNQMRGWRLGTGRGQGREWRSYVGRVAEGMVDELISGDTGGNGPSESEDITWGRGKKEASYLENSTQGTRTWPFCSFAGSQEGGGRRGVTLFFKLLAKKKLVGGRGLREKLQGMEEK